MRLSIKAFALAAGILWGSALLVVTCANLVFPGYAENFLAVVASVYPGYHYGSGISGIIIAALYGFVDAGIAGAVFAWLYNLISKEKV